MNTTQPIQNLGRWLALSVAVVLLSGCELPSPDTVQHGYRGTGMLQVYNTRLLAQTVEANVPPVATPPLPAAGPKASQTYKNVKVLGDGSSQPLSSTTATLKASQRPKV